MFKEQHGSWCDWSRVSKGRRGQGAKEVRTECRNEQMNTKNMGKEKKETLLRSVLWTFWHVAWLSGKNTCFAVSEFFFWFGYLGCLVII